ncbi:hypothetical protein [Achromobacter pestifer]|uniref:hypothetical protein n=1 Tax=Achromobacter pestifer TaxID=1353889 RepID=UPI00158142C6|nr:hypothetical protein [Achromobacter pestifer]
MPAVEDRRSTFPSCPPSGIGDFSWFLIKTEYSLHRNNQAPALSGEIRVFPKHFAKKPAGREPAVCHPVFFFS